MTMDVINEMDHVLTEVLRSGALTEQSQRRALTEARRFGEHLIAGSVESLNDTPPVVVLRFVDLSGSDEPPSVATMHFRRSIVRLVFATARRLSIASIDPTLDLALPPRSTSRARSLTDDEIALCRDAAVNLGATRHAAAIALAEATTRTSELALVRASHLDLDDKRVWIVGSSKTDPRWGHLTPWGIEQIRARLRHVGNDGTVDPFLISRGSPSPESRQASSCIALSTVLKSAGLHEEPDVRPASVAAWAGARDFAWGASIEQVARRLGVRSLDQAARLIGWTWSDT